MENNYQQAFEASWLHLVDWVLQGKFVPKNEEDIQCFLYHGLVQQLGTAIGIRPKATSCKPQKLKFYKGNLLVGDMHFPDLVLGLNEENPDLVVEIKFIRKGRSTLYSKCKADVEKLKKHHDSRAHYFVLFDEHPEYVFFDEHQSAELKSLSSSNCKFLHYPLVLNTSPGKAIARKAIETMRRNNMDFKKLGTENAKKAVQGAKRRSKARPDAQNDLGLK